MAANEALDELYALVRTCDKERPAKTDLDKLRSHLDKHADLAMYVGDLAIQARMQIVDNAMPKKGAALCIDVVFDQMVLDLGYKEAGPIEKSLIMHICLCWLRLHVCELRYESNAKNNQTLTQGEYWDKKLSSHQRRYLRAVETLAKVRRLMQPAPNPLTMMLVKQQIGK